MAESRCPHGFLRSQVRCICGCDAPPPVDEVSLARKASRNRAYRARKAARLSPRVPTPADLARRERLEPLLVRVAAEHGIEPSRMLGDGRWGGNSDPIASAARIKLARLAKAELMMSAAEVSTALGLNVSTMPAAVARRAS